MEYGAMNAPQLQITPTVTIINNTKTQGLLARQFQPNHSRLFYRERDGDTEKLRYLSKGTQLV